jgi:glycosyltransferase 2 family protein
VSADAAAHRRSREASLPWWRTVHRQRWFGPTLAIGLLALVAWLLADHVKEIDWRQVRASIAAYPLPTLAAAAGLVVLSHLVYASYDLLGRRYTGHPLPPLRVLAVAFVSYAFNLNLGSLIGGFGFRIRLYSRLGLDANQIARVIALSLVTNWSGWLLLTGAVFAAKQIHLPPSFPLPAIAMQAIGVAMVALPLAYLAACFFSKRREWRWRDPVFVLPGGRMALAQLGVSTLNWALIGTIVWLLLPRELAWGTVLATLLSAAVIAVPTHVPGGLGVLEAVFVAVLGDQVAPARLVAALLAYRALYYLVPLALATTLHFYLEALARRDAGRGAWGKAHRGTTSLSA